MKSCIVFVALIAVAVADTAVSNQDIQIVKFEQEKTDNGYKFNYETSDGAAREEEAEVKNAGTDDQYVVIRGWYKWIAPDGIDYKVNYLANETGFHPEGAHIPKA